MKMFKNQKEFMNIFCAKTKTLSLEDCLIYEHLISEIKWVLIANKVVFALFASNILILKKWRATTLNLGVKAVIQAQTTVKCFAEIAMERKLTSIKALNEESSLLIGYGIILWDKFVFVNLQIYLSFTQKDINLNEMMFDKAIYLGD